MEIHLACVCVAGAGNGNADHGCHWTVRICQRSFNMKLWTRNLSALLFLRRPVILESSIIDNIYLQGSLLCVGLCIFNSNITGAGLLGFFLKHAALAYAIYICTQTKLQKWWIFILGKNYTRTSGFVWKKRGQSSNKKIIQWLKTTARESRKIPNVTSVHRPTK